jgi:hypothetical protein
MLFQYRFGILAMLGRYYGFDLRQLVSFAEVARLKSYRAAAARLNIAQPAISRQFGYRNPDPGPGGIVGSGLVRSE